MTDNGLLDALRRIADVANAAIGEREDEGGEPSEGEALTCTPKMLPKRLWMKAASFARDVNPVNGVGVGALAEAGISVMEPLEIAVLTAKYWGPASRRLTVSFMESTSAALRTKIISHMNAWNRTCGISFVETTGTGNVRISRGPGGYWSYLGTDIGLIPRSRPTMNLQSFSLSTPDSEYRRVVRHETGHTLGFPHEHMRRTLVARLNREECYEYFLRTQGWDKATVDAQVLTPLNEASLMATPADQTSIMCYQLPGTITNDGRPILGGTDINATDYAFAGRIYPRTGRSFDVSESDVTESTESAGDWGEEEDPKLNCDVSE